VPRFAEKVPWQDRSHGRLLPTREEVKMGVLWALVLLLIIFAIVGGAAFNSWLFLIIVIAVILALAGAF
jgi:hypothetical protein